MQPINAPSRFKSKYLRYLCSDWKPYRFENWKSIFQSWPLRIHGKTSSRIDLQRFHINPNSIAIWQRPRPLRDNCSLPQLSTFVKLFRNNPIDYAWKALLTASMNYTMKLSNLTHHWTLWLLNKKQGILNWWKPKKKDRKSRINKL